MCFFWAAINNGVNPLESVFSVLAPKLSKNLVFSTSPSFTAMRSFVEKLARIEAMSMVGEGFAECEDWMSAGLVGGGLIGNGAAGPPVTGSRKIPGVTAGVR